MTNDLNPESMLARPVASEPPQQSVWSRRLQITALLILAPVCAEYLAAYDDTTGDAVRLFSGLIIFVPLYGAPALLIREVARRAGLGWIGIILLAAAFGLLEAGVVDQSLFSLGYRDIASWDDDLRGTFIHPLGLSAFNVLNFVGGHVIYSMGAPIALAEGLRPSRSREPWLSRRWLVVFAVLYAAASALVLGDSLMHESYHASLLQIAGSLVVIALMVFGAFRFGRRVPSVDRPAVRTRTVFLVALGVALVYSLSPPTWTGCVISLSSLALLAVLLRRSSTSRGWSLQHAVAVASAFVLTRAVLSFTYFPVIGDVSAVRKYGHSAVLLVAMVAICLLAERSSSGQGGQAAVHFRSDGATPQTSAGAE